MKHRTISVCASVALACLLAAGVNLPVRAQASEEAQQLALQLVQRAELKKLPVLAMRAQAWAQVINEPVDSGSTSNRDRHYSYYECLQDKDATPLEVPLAKMLASRLTMQDMRELLEFYAGPTGKPAIQMTLRAYLASLELPRMGEYASFLSPTTFSSTEQETASGFFRSEAFTKMMKPLAQGNPDYLAAMSVLMNECVEVFVPPALKTSTPPVYPLAARRAGVEGAMVLRVHIDATGRAKEARVLKRWFNARGIPDSTGPKSVAEVFDESAVSYAMNSSYTPAMRNGVAVETWMNLPIRFLLEK